MLGEGYQHRKRKTTKIQQEDEKEGHMYIKCVSWDTTLFAFVCFFALHLAELTFNRVCF
jgi:hypothetical protein